VRLRTSVRMCFRVCMPLPTSTFAHVNSWCSNNYVIRRIKQRRNPFHRHKWNSPRTKMMNVKSR